MGGLFQLGRFAQADFLAQHSLTPQPPRAIQENRIKEASATGLPLIKPLRSTPYECSSTTCIFYCDLIAVVSFPVLHWLCDELRVFGPCHECKTTTKV